MLNCNVCSFEKNKHKIFTFILKRLFVFFHQWHRHGWLISWFRKLFIDACFLLPLKYILYIPYSQYKICLYKLRPNNNADICINSFIQNAMKQVCLGQQNVSTQTFWVEKVLIGWILLTKAAGQMCLVHR